MPKINILSPFVADLIAAGEVVERPASVVKELVENAVDAGARSITIEIRSGGAEYIRVTDDGSGMAPEDAGVAFVRHATSKLHNEAGLEAIGTLGFRGEALAAIASVSHIELLTRERGAASGTRLLLDAGEIAEMHEAGCPEGTSITVRGLFHNTPARYKFMKSDRAEGSACVTAALRAALGRPDISVRCIKDGKEEFFTPGDGRAASAVYALLGREIASSMLPCASDDAHFSVSGFVSAPHAGRGNRTAQYFYCNGRHIKSQLLQAAVEQAYRNTMLSGRFPACVIYLSLSNAAVDVNVHPAKTEVKFSDEKRVFDAVYYAALGALEEGRPPAEVRADLSAPPKVASTPTVPAQPASAAQTSLFRYSEARGAADAPFSGSGGASLRSAASQYRAGDLESVMRPYMPPEPAALSRAAEPPDSAPDNAGGAVSAQPVIESPGDPPRVIGEVLGLYILAEQNGALVIIDKHAAHERIIFDRLQKGESGIMSQALLEPVTVRVGGDGVELLEESAALLADAGFSLEAFGEADVIVRAAPYRMAPGDIRAAVEELIDALRDAKTPESARDRLLKTVACKAAIRAGDENAGAEFARLAEEVCSGRVRYCPHGRPVARTLTRADLDKLFDRIV